MNVEGRKFVLTGGSSLIGSAIARRLLKRGAANLVLYDNLSLGSTTAMEDLLEDPRVVFVEGDILDTESLTDAFADADGVFALAAFLTIPLGKNPALGLRVNVDGMVSTFEAAVSAGVGKVLMASSISVYGDNIAGEITEANAFGSTTLSPPFALYGLSKLIGEQLGRLYSQRHALEFNAVRFSTVYGVRQHDRGVNALQMVEAYDAVKSGATPRVVGSGEDAHDFIYVDDAAEGAIAAMQSGRSGESYMIATGSATTTNQLVQTVLDVMHSDATIVHEEDTRTAAPTTHSSLSLNVAKSARDLNWRATTNLTEGVTRLVKWLDGRAS